MRTGRGWNGVVAAGVMSTMACALAQPVIDPGELTQWPEGDRQAYAEMERKLVGMVTPHRLRSWHALLASEPHMAGTAGDMAVIQRLVDSFTEMGLEVERHEFDALLPWPGESSVRILAPADLTLSLREEPLEPDRDSGDPRIPAAFNAFGGSGEAQGEVVYANYGTKEDFAQLKALGVSCAGKIVVARYGRNYRGFKAKFAEEAGAAALIIYTDPQDSGYVKGVMYPEGGWDTPHSIQRGSVLTLGYSGDPLTPGVESRPGGPRKSIEEVGLLKIPVQPMSWTSASEILSRMRGPGVPEGWQGGLPFAYRVTGGESLIVNVSVKQEREIRRSANVIGVLKGSVWPDQVVVVGAHHDAWGFGASDPLSGTICVMEAARAFAALAKEGKRPARSIAFAGWGAEEFGIIGSTEWVEGNAGRLSLGGVAYLNLDMASMGPNFGSSASPSLRRVITSVSRAVPQARDAERSVFQAWTGANPLPKFGDLGGGSDHIGFLCHLGIASASLGGGGSPGSSYHTAYDTLAWYERVVGRDYEPALMVARMTIATASRLANAPLVPLDPARAAADAPGHLETAAARGAALKLFDAKEPWPELDRVRESFRAYGVVAEDVRDRAEAAVGDGRLTGADLEAVNRALIALDRGWVDEQGLAARPWFRNLYAANDEDSGYASWMLPALREALERGGRETFAAAAERYVRACARQIDTARGIDAVLQRVEARDATPAPGAR